VVIGEVNDHGGQELPPVAATLMESLRAVGYSTSAALADLLDNSVSAGAKNIAITFSAAPDPWLAVIDDGRGMGRDELIAAMRYGSRDPREPRAVADLGRFGLGLKTASLSQCRRMTVVSFNDGVFSVAVWDLDECERRRCWWLGTPSTDGIPESILNVLATQGRGTAVIWEDLDRLLEGSQAPARALDQIMDSAADHLAMVFHRYLDGSYAGAFEITVNARPLARMDPFLEGHVRGQALHPESFKIEGHEVVVSPFVLPFPSRLRPDDLEKAGGRESLKTGHGFYIYRGGRLVVPGGWFRIVPSDDLIRLARVRVDVPAELDHLWKVDIRKTVAEPPLALRNDLKRIVGAATVRSRRVYSHKGTAQQQADRIGLWGRHDLRDGAAAWKINRDHPAVAAVVSNVADPRHADQLLKLIEELLPVHDIHLHISNDLPVSETVSAAADDLEELANQLAAAFADRPDDRKLLLDRLHLIDPFNRAPDTARQIAERLKS
jgi:hypothetical protein